MVKAIICLVLLMNTKCGLARNEDPFFIKFYKNMLESLTGKTTTPEGLSEAKKLGKLQEPLPEDTLFPCNISNGRSLPSPTSVHRVRPGDIDIIASIGDSHSVGNGLAASSISQAAVENRGLSWAIGGRGKWNQYLTLANILKEFNPDLIGYAVEDVFGFMPKAQFSVAEPGAMSRDMLHSAKVLVQRIKKDGRVNFEMNWKLVNFFIGGNDFCADLCFLNENNLKNSHESHRKDLYRAFDYLQNNLPRTLVNFIRTPKTDMLKNLLKRSNSCVMSHQFYCPCLFKDTQNRRLDLMRQAQDNWIQVQEQVAKDARYRTKSDFAILLQPFLANSEIPHLSTTESDYTFLSTDCYHLSQKGSARAANALWNNMLEPFGNKSLQWNPTFKKFNCPSESHPFIFTWANSN